MDVFFGGEFIVLVESCLSTVCLLFAFFDA